MIRNGDKSLVLRLAGENNLSAPIIAALNVEDQSLLASVLSSAMRLHNIIDAYDEDHAENFAQLFDGKFLKVSFFCLKYMFEKLIKSHIIWGIILKA